MILPVKNHPAIERHASALYIALRDVSLNPPRTRSGPILFVIFTLAFLWCSCPSAWRSSTNGIPSVSRRARASLSLMGFLPLRT